MATDKANQNDTSYLSMDRKSNFESKETTEADLQNIDSDEVEARPTNQAPSFIMRVMLTSGITFLIAIGLELFIMHLILDNPEVESLPRVAILAAMGGLLGAIVGMITAFAYVLKKQFDYKNVVLVMGTLLLIFMVGIAIALNNNI